MQLRREEVSHDRGQGGEEGRQEDAHLPHVDSHVERVEDVVDDAGCNLQEYRCTEYRCTKYRVQSTEYRAQSTEYRVESKKVQSRE